MGAIFVRQPPGSAHLLGPSAPPISGAQGLLGGTAPQSAASPPQDLLSRLLAVLQGSAANSPRPPAPGVPLSAAQSPAATAGGDDPIVCVGRAKYTAVGPGQATGAGALSGHGVRPLNGTVAIGDPERVFGLDKPGLAKIAPQIRIQPTGLDQQLVDKRGPAPPYSVGDIGDKNIRNSLATRFDIYRFRSLPLARTFMATAPTTITIPNVPGVHCPPDFLRARRDPPNPHRGS